MNIAELTAEIALAAVVVGTAGSLIEAIGEALEKPVLVKLGQKIESLSADIPKLLGRS